MSHHGVELQAFATAVVTEICPVPGLRLPAPRFPHLIPAYAYKVLGFALWIFVSIIDCK